MASEESDLGGSNGLHVLRHSFSSSLDMSSIRSENFMATGLETHSVNNEVRIFVVVYSYFEKGCRKKNIKGHATRPKGGLGIHWNFAYWPGGNLQVCIFARGELVSSQEAFIYSFNFTVACL